MSSLRLFAMTNYELSAANGGDGMKRSNGSRMCTAIALCTVTVVFPATQLMAQVASLDPAKMPTIGTVDERFQSYNIEMVEVIGGRFWKPYGSTTNESKAQEPAPQAGVTPAGIDPNLYRYRAPIDLSNSRLRKLAAALSPAYVRVSGTWANSAYFQDSENAAPANAPAGFSGVLTREEWKGVVDFSHQVNAEIVTSVASGQDRVMLKAYGPRTRRGNCSNTPSPLEDESLRANS
jgi:heparanase 1